MSHRWSICLPLGKPLVLSSVKHIHKHTHTQSEGAWHANDKGAFVYGYGK